MTPTRAARAALVETLGPVVAPIPVFDYPPPEPVAPYVYLGDVARRAGELDGVPHDIATVPVVLVVDGADYAQRTTLDDAGDAIWWALSSDQWAPLRADPGDVDTGGPRLRTLTTLVDVYLTARTLCISEVAA